VFLVSLVYKDVSFIPHRWRKSMGVAMGETTSLKSTGNVALPAVAFFMG
jgi:hypothetical protein